jgi:hypothetical protein
MLRQHRHPAGNAQRADPKLNLAQRAAHCHMESVIPRGFSRLSATTANQHSFDREEVQTEDVLNDDLGHRAIFPAQKDLFIALLR